MTYLDMNDGGPWCGSAACSVARGPSTAAATCASTIGCVVVQNTSGGLDCSYQRSGRRSPRLSSCRVGPRWPSVKAVIVRQVRKPAVKTKGPGASDGERSFGRHPSNSFTTPDTKRTKGQGPGMVNVLLAATHSNSFTTCGLRGQGQGW